MRRGGQSTGGGGGGFSKPPPAPLTHGGAGRVRLHTPEANGGTKDRFGSRERSPSLGSSLPHSPSHPANHSLPASREKSPNIHSAAHSLPGSRERSPNVHPAAHSLPGSREKSPNPQGLGDLHDCSMCLSAYIQSLNTVCGTACRLSQCLAQVWTETAVGDVRGNPVREAADAWEGVARAVGVASAAIKTQMFVLLQEVQARQDLSGEARRQEINKISQAMLGAFLNLQFQFSAVIIERFSLILQNLREDNYTCTSVPPTSCPPGNVTDTSQLALSNQYNGQNWPPSQGGWTGRGGGGPSPLLESPVKEEKSRSRHSSSGQSVNNQTGIAASVSAAGGSTVSNTTTNPSAAAHSQPTSIQQQNVNNQSATVRIPQPGPWPNSSPNGNNYNNTLNNPNYQSNISVNGLSCSSSNNTLSPGSCYGLFPQGMTNGNMGMWNTDAISRRWSMGGPGSAPEGWIDRCPHTGGIGPFSLIGNRRWSVPEASEHDLGGITESDLNDLYNSNMVPGDWGGTASSWGSQRGLYVPSRDSSITRSPSHSRSVTPGLRYCGRIEHWTFYKYQDGSILLRGISSTTI